MTMPTIAVMRRTVLQTAVQGSIGAAATAIVARPSHAANLISVDDRELVRRLIGTAPTESSRIPLRMPPAFGNGYTVPLTLDVDSPMTEVDHVRVVHIVAPRNPIIVTAAFFFTPQSGRAHLSTRIRLSEPQNVLAVAQMSDGAVLMARTWVKVDTNGCA